MSSAAYVEPAIISARVPPEIKRWIDQQTSTFKMNEGNVITGLVDQVRLLCRGDERNHESFVISALQARIRECENALSAVTKAAADVPDGVTAPPKPSELIAKGGF